MNESGNAHHARRFYRDPERGVILGVCAGMAACFDWPLWLTRLAVFALGWLFPLTVALGYLVAAAVLPERPLRYGGAGDERTFWQSRATGADT